MPIYYDIYGLSKHRDKAIVENFLSQFSHRDKIENREGQAIAIYKNEKYKIKETWIPIKTLTEVIDYGLKNINHGFAFYIDDNLKDGISHIILKFTYDNNIIFGISIEENKSLENGDLIDNYDKALKVENLIIELTNAKKTSIQVENPPSNDEEEFDNEIEIWKNMNEEKRRR